MCVSEEDPSFLEGLAVWGMCACVHVCNVIPMGHCIRGCLLPGRVHCNECAGCSRSVYQVVEASELSSDQLRSDRSSLAEEEPGSCC